MSAFLFCNLIAFCVLFHAAPISNICVGLMGEICDENWLKRLFYDQHGGNCSAGLNLLCRLEIALLTFLREL